MRLEVIALARRLKVDQDAAVELWRERAAIREHEGGQPRPAAERHALEDVREVLGRQGPAVRSRR
jgi:hypothetical protein